MRGITMSNVQQDYKRQGDDMREILPPDYQEWLDSLPELTTEEMDNSLDELLAECEERDNEK